MSDDDEFRKRFEPSAASTPQLVKLYEAAARFTTGTSPERFELHLANGDFYQYSYGHLIELAFVGGHLLLTTTTRVFTLSGRNLSKLAPIMAEKKAKALHEYVADRHEKPSADAIVIEAIEMNEDNF